MMTSFYNLLKYAATGIASPDMTYYDRMRASTLMGGVVQTLTGIPPLSFKSDGSPLISWSMKGNGQQSGTPTPDNPIMPNFCGTLDGTDWTIPITCAGQTTSVYLGQVSTVRRIKKLVLTGGQDESWTYSPISGLNRGKLGLFPNAKITECICSHYKYEFANVDGNVFVNSTLNEITFCDNVNAADNTTWRAYLQQQYANGTPVTVWYVLANEQTGIVNEPLAKIGDYADELHSEDAAITIPTAKGQNTLTVETDLQPSEMTITYRG